MFRKISSTVIIALGLVAGSAFAQGIGTITAISGETGTVIVQRGADTYSLGLNDELFPGDKIVTREGGTVQFSAYGCSVDLEGGSMATLNADFCATTPVTTTAEVLPPAEPVVTGVTAASNTGLLIGAGLLGAGAIAAAAGSGGGNDTPASP